MTTSSAVIWKLIYLKGLFRNHLYFAFKKMCQQYIVKIDGDN